MKEPFKVWNNVYAVGSADISHPDDCIVYLIDFGELVLIDSGAGSSFDTLVTNIEKLGFDPNRLKTILATHAHIDHIGSLYKFQQIFGAQIMAHALDAKGIQQGIRIGAELYGVYYTPCNIDRIVKDSDEHIRFEGGELNIIHSPGHTPGSLTAYIDTDNRRVLFGQDIHGPYYVRWGGDPKQAKKSLQRLLKLKADILCEGHFGIYQPASEVEKYLKGYINSL
ncbi:MAG: MBL fold metallo-hydrolase [Chloroflexota bacterium]|nr:MBL fold metallo-hydrolase [Chloroflexota bacterium]